MSAAAPRVPFLDLRTTNLRHEADYSAVLRRVLDSGQVLLGSETEAFEREFATFCGAAHCVSVGNGLDALQLVLRAWEIGPGQEVIVPSHTFIATWLAVCLVGATPVPAEPDPLTFNLSADVVGAAITSRTRAIIPVHLYGRPAPMVELSELAERHNLLLLEDAAQAHGARLGDRACGNLGHAAGFSFYPGKNLGALGDAGAVVTNDAGLADRVRKLRSYGSTVKYHHELAGVNSRMDELQAGFLRARLAVLEADNTRRSEIASAYLAGMAGLPQLTLPGIEANAQSSWHLFVVRHPRRADLVRLLTQAGIATQIHYPVPPHRQPALAQLATAAMSLPVADQLGREVLSLPIGPDMPNSAVQAVIAAVRDACYRLAVGPAATDAAALST